MLHPCETASIMRLLQQPGPPAGHSKAQVPAIQDPGPSKAHIQAAQHSAAGQAPGREQPPPQLPGRGQDQPAPEMLKGGMSVEGCGVRLGQADALQYKGLVGLPGVTGSTGKTPARGSACTAGLGAEAGDLHRGEMHTHGKYMLAWLSFVGPPLGLTVPACLPQHLAGETQCG